VQEEAFTMFEEIEGQGSQLDQVVVTVAQCLEGPVTMQMIQEFTEQEAQQSNKSRYLRAKLEAFEAVLPRSE
jgi:hypothetical protein